MMLGRVYRLSAGDLVYYGSTVSSLVLRKSQHKYNAINDFRRTSQKLFDTGLPVNIQCLEELVVLGPQSVKLRMREQYYIENNKCINKKRAYAGVVLGPIQRSPSFV